MKTFLVSLALLNSMSAFAAGTCDSSAAKLALTQAQEINREYRKCDSFQCAKKLSTAVQDKMCEAATACREIAYDMYYPCDQRMYLTEEDYDFSYSLKRLIRKGMNGL